MDKQKITGYPSIDKPWLKYYKKSFLKKPIQDMNIYSYLKTMTDDYLDYIAISYFGGEISFWKLFSNIDIAAKLLIENTTPPVVLR